MDWTEEQRKAIEMRGKNMLVSAAAGSGKTAVLVERIKRLILEDEVELSQMLIVTFSNAAASEMREKIAAAIGKAMELPHLPREKGGFLRRQLNNLHKANISTFHAFSMEVIRRYFHLIQLEPNFKICDDGQKAILQAEALDDLFTRSFESADPDFLSFLNCYASSKNENAVREMIIDTHQFIQSIPDPQGWISDQIHRLSGGEKAFLTGPVFSQMTEDIRQSLLLCRTYMEETAQLLEDSGVASLLPKCGLDLEQVSALLSAFDQSGGSFADPASQMSDEAGREGAAAWFDGLASAIRQVKFQTFRASKEDGPAYEEVRDQVKRLRDRGKELLKQVTETYCQKPLSVSMGEVEQTAEAARILAELVSQFDSLYREKKEKKRLLDFNDIEHYALEALSHPEAAKEYRNRFRYLFIDEYQDSNLVQETLIGRIKREDNLFMVGDVKQSIYKFRLAEPEIFIRKYEAFRQGDRPHDCKLDLNLNFRSKGQVVSGVNAVFSKVMTKSSTGMDYDEDARLHQGVSYEGILDYPVELHLADDRQLGGSPEDPELDEEIQEMKKAEVEGAVAAQIILQALGKPIYDGKQGLTRPLENRDVVILLRGAKNYGDLYYQALMQAGIPAFVDAGDGYFDALEIQVFLNVLRVIDNRKQDVALLSALRSSIFGFSITQLAQIRAAHRDGSYFEALAAAAEEAASPEAGEPAALADLAGFEERAPGQESASQQTSSDWEEDAPGQESAGQRFSYLPEGLPRKCLEAVERLSRWKEQSTYLPLDEFLWMLIRDTGYGLYVSALPGGAQRQANLRALVDKAVVFQRSQMKGLFGFIRYLEALQKRKVSTGQVRLLSESDNVVRIMTVHKSKGLEFPFVLLGGMGKRFNRAASGKKLMLHKDLGLALRLVNPEDSCYRKTILQAAVERKKEAEDMAEEIRILYVAFTRAMDQLVLLGTLTNAREQLKRLEYRPGEDVLGTKSYLELIYPALLEGGIPCQIHDRSEIHLAKKEEGRNREELRRSLVCGFSLSGTEEEQKRICDEVKRRMGCRYPYERAVRMKSKYSVSQLARLLTQESAGSSWKPEGSGQALFRLTDENWKELERMLFQSQEEDQPDFTGSIIDVVPRFTLGDHKLTAAEKGTVLHRIMERIPFDETRFSGQNARLALEEFVKELIQKGILTEEEGKAADLRKIEGFFLSPEGIRACRAAEVQKEISFNLKKQLDQEEILLQGTIDCFFREADGRYVLLDYKSNYIPKNQDGIPDPKEIISRYRPQLLLYREALEKIRGVSVDEMYLYLFGLGRGVKVE